MRDGFRLFGKHPLPFSLMFVMWLAATTLLSAIPLLGVVLGFASLPLVTLGFMVAAESALQGGPVHPGQFVSPLRSDSARRRSLLVLCAIYGVLMVAVMAMATWVDDGAFAEFMMLLSKDDRAAAAALVREPAFALGMAFRLVTITLIGLPFWHAPALVHWGGQGPAQALFSSALAVWRCKGAFLVYGLAWFGITALFGTLVSTLFELMGTPEFAGLTALPAGLIFSTVFYVSLLFTFNDSFGGSGAVAPEP